MLCHYYSIIPNRDGVVFCILLLEDEDVSRDTLRDNLLFSSWCRSRHLASMESSLEYAQHTHTHLFAMRHPMLGCLYCVRVSRHPLQGTAPKHYHLLSPLAGSLNAHPLLRGLVKYLRGESGSSDGRQLAVSWPSAWKTMTLTMEKPVLCWTRTCAVSRAWNNPCLACGARAG